MSSTRKSSRQRTQKCCTVENTSSAPCCPSLWKRVDTGDAPLQPRRPYRDPPTADEFKRARAGRGKSSKDDKYATDSFLNIIIEEVWKRIYDEVIHDASNDLWIFRVSLDEIVDRTKYSSMKMVTDRSREEAKIKYHLTRRLQEGDYPFLVTYVKSVGHPQVPLGDVEVAIKLDKTKLEGAVEEGYESTSAPTDGGTEECVDTSSRASEESS